MELTSFEPFPRLPLEIRLLIWQHAIQPRLVPLVWTPHLSECITPSIPPLLHVSREARAEALRAYTTTVQYKDQNHSEESLAVSNGKIFFNYNIDTAMITIANYGPSILNGFHRAKPHMRVHYQHVKFVVIDSFSLDFGPGIVISSAKTHFPLLEEFSITDDRGKVLQEERTLELVNTSVGGAERMPILKCLMNGYECEQHWWFKAWNECERREVESWGKAYSWVTERVYHRYHRFSEHMALHTAETDQRGHPIDLADAVAL